MKIAYIASPSVHTNRWMKHFADRGHEVHLITVSAPDTLPDNIKLHRLKRIGPRSRALNYLLNTISLVTQFNRLLKEIKPDVIHAHQVMDITLLGAASGFHPFVVSPWGSDVLIAPQKSRISRWSVQYILRKADLITCDAEHIKAPLVKFGVDPERIKLIYFGTDMKKFSPARRDEKLRQELGFDAPVIVSSRHLDPLYDVGSLIKAGPLVLKEYPQAKFLIVGGGSEADALKELAKSLGVQDKVTFVGRLPENELPRYIASSDIYVSTSLSDAGLASSTAEAMACGLPAIITDFGDNKLWIKDGVNGFLVPLRSPEALAAKIVYLLKNEADRKRFGALSRRLIEEKKDNEKEMDKMGKLYEQLVGRNK